MKRIVTLIIVLVMLMTLTSCGENENNREFKGSSDIEISDPVFNLATVEDFDKNGKWNLNADAMKLNVDTEYYLNMSFDVEALKDNDGQSMLGVKITFDEVDILSYKMQGIGTGIYSSWDSDESDSDTGKIEDVIVMSFRIPHKKSEPMTIDAKIKLKPLKAGDSQMSVNFEYNKPDGVEIDKNDPDAKYKILGSDGYTMNIEVKKVKIEAPTLRVDEMGNIRWNHVKNAVQYKIYEMGSNVPLKNKDGEDIIIEAENFSVGSEMICNIGEHLRDVHIIHIRAFSHNASIDPSDYSNFVQHVW